ncbi:MAG TPA: TRAP transporter small permease subunit [Thermodesulfobacteriota bacterium]|nr:TRAP transporter small permease subunit [Thermodesulfobacteriota bacterium]
MAERRGPLARLVGGLAAATEWLAAALLVAMVVVVTLGVVYRYLLGSALVWYDEFAAYLLVWLTFVGAVGALYRRRHIGFELLAERASPRMRRAIALLAEAAILLFALLLLVHGAELVRRMGDERAVSLVWVRMGWVYAVLPAAGGLMALTSLFRLVRLLRRGGPQGADRA